MEILLQLEFLEVTYYSLTKDMEL